MFYNDHKSYMKGMEHMNKAKRVPNSTRVVWLCALALTLLTVVTAPFAVSRYVAQGQGTARARIAAWEVSFDSSRVVVGRLMDVISDETQKTKTYTGMFDFSSSSEVMANVVPVLTHSTGTADPLGPGHNDFTAAYANTRMDPLTGAVSVDVIIDPLTKDSWGFYYFDINVEQVD